MALSIFSIIFIIVCLSRIFVIMDSTERVKLRQFCLLSVSIVVIFCVILLKVCVVVFFICDILFVAFFFYLFQSDFRFVIQFSRSWFLVVQVFFCFDMTLFSVSGLSLYCFFRRCFVVFRFVCRLVSFRFFVLMAVRFVRCCCANLFVCCVSAFRRF